MKRIAIPVITDELCHYGCGHIARFKNGSGNLMCLERCTQCPSVRKRNSKGCKSSGRDYSGWYNTLSQESKDKMNWAKGKNCSDPKVYKFAKGSLGKRRITEESKLKKVIYREQCAFNLAGIIHRVLGYELLLELGMYHRKSNKNGVVRDHMISVDYGFNNSIDPKIISHPANCRFIPHSENAKKTARNEGTIECLIERIRIWDAQG